MAAPTESPGDIRTECVTSRMALFLESVEPVRAERNAWGLWLSPVSPHLTREPLHLLIQPLPSPLVSAAFNTLRYDCFLLCLAVDSVSPPEGPPQEGKGFLCLAPIWVPSTWHTVVAQ